MKRRTCLFMVNGLGMGNSTRCYAIIKKLAAEMDVHVLTCGNGVNFFEDKGGLASLNSMEALFYASKDGGISVAKTFLSIRELLRLFSEKSKKVSELISKINPDVVMTDSEYSIFPVLKRRIPLIGLNNSDVIVSEYFAGHNYPSSIKGQFWMVELNDYLFHRTFYDMVISPAATQVPVRNPKFKRVGLVVRDEVIEAAKLMEGRDFPAPKELKSVVFMLSGSVFASKIGPNLDNLPYKVDVVGRTGENSANVTYHGRMLNSVGKLKEADILVINGGFSAVSEAIALNKPTIVIPVPGHAEQYINGRLIQKLGRGYLCGDTEAPDMLRKLHSLNKWDGLGPKSAPANINGAAEAADAVFRFCAERQA